jgi:hypothetical protein
MMGMNDYIIPEGNLLFDFSHCGKPVKFDKNGNNGIFAVDFLVDRAKYMLFIEVKDYQNPNTPPTQRNDDLRMLVEAGKADESIFSIEIGRKITDSLLTLYAKGEVFSKNVRFLLFINFDELKANERTLLYKKLMRYIPTVLNNIERFPAFKEITFEIVDVKRLRKYGIICSVKN